MTCMFCGEMNCYIIPVDSEHNLILCGLHLENLKKNFITHTIIKLKQDEN